MKTIEALVNFADPALPLLSEWANDPAGNAGILLPPSEAIRRDTLHRLQVTTRSLLGTVVYETGGVSIANGLLRLLGSGAERSLRQTHQELGFPFDRSYPDFIMVADDVLGGLFALNGGRFGPHGQGKVFHLAADDIVWVPLDIGYGEFVSWCLTGNLKQFYRPYIDLEAYDTHPRPPFDSVYSHYPFLWTKEAKNAKTSVRVINANESMRLRIDLSGFATMA